MSETLVTAPNDQERIERLYAAWLREESENRRLRDILITIKAAIHEHDKFVRSTVPMPPPNAMLLSAEQALTRINKAVNKGTDNANS